VNKGDILLFLAAKGIGLPDIPDNDGDGVVVESDLAAIDEILGLTEPQHVESAADQSAPAPTPAEPSGPSAEPPASPAPQPPDHSLLPVGAPH
jgi:hypothetical protein